MHRQLCSMGHLLDILPSEWLSGGGGKKKQAVFEGGGQNTDPQSMDYPKMDYATEV